MRAKLNFLKGVRVADFCWMGAGPFGTKMLSDFGAEVFKIEGVSRLDPLRAISPFADSVRGANRSAYFASRNTGKKSVTLDLKSEGGRALAIRLIEECDVVTSNFGPGVMQRLGFGYEDMRKIKSDIIHLSMPMYGQDGPRALMLGLGLTINAISGLLWMTAYGDNDPVGPGTHYPDHAANPYHAAFALMAALRRRKLTGEGMEIDVSQVESTVNFMGPEIVRYSLSGKEPPQIGNGSLSESPHGIYRCEGDDAWCAVAARDANQWKAMARLIGRTDLADDERLLEVGERIRRRAEIDAALGPWLLGRAADTAARQLQAIGVAASVVASSQYLLEKDENLSTRGYWERLEHPDMGVTTFTSPPFVVDGQRMRLERPPLLGEHTVQVLNHVLNVNESDIAALVAEGSIELVDATA